jgi:hypothetical protein
MAVEQMTEPETTGEASGQGSPPTGDVAMFEPGLPVLTTKLPRDEVVKRLESAARKGKLAGFEKREGPELFEVEAFSTPFDHLLLAMATQDSAGTKLSFRLHMLRKSPAIFAATIIVSIWPGLPLTHSMLVTYFSSYSHVATWVTAAWYLPLTVVPFFWFVPKSLKRSGKEARESAREQILKLRDLLDGTLTQG